MVTDCGTITIEAAFDSSLVNVIGCDIPSTATEGEQTTVGLQVSNQNSNAGATAEVALLLNGTQEATQTVTLGATENTTVEYQITPSSAGDLNISGEVVSASEA